MNVVIIGAQASGKMTIGQQLEKMTGLTLFHNHETIDFVCKFIPMSPESRALIDTIRLEFFQTFAKTGRGMIFTMVIDFALEEDIAFLEKIQNIFHEAGQSILFVELETELTERLRRNETENRLAHKPIKRNIEWSKQDILDTAQCTFNPEQAPSQLARYVKINNTHLSADEVARWIALELEKS